MTLQLASVLFTAHAVVLFVANLHSQETVQGTLVTPPASRDRCFSRTATFMLHDSQTALSMTTLGLLILALAGLALPRRRTRTVR